MATYTVKAIDPKNADWKVLTLDDNGVEIKEVSVNRVNQRSNEVFPGFDEIVKDGIVAGELWVSGSGKNYLFPPNPVPTASTGAPGGRGGAFKSMQIDKAMGRKEESIGKFQDSKEYGIKVSSTFRSATDTAIAEYQENHRISTTGPTLEQLFEKWREYYWMRFDVVADEYPPML